jgi:hypothetical protein
MRSIFFALALTFAATACTKPNPRYVNVASVRSEINGTIRSTTNDRTIHSMGKVTADRAIVYTTSKDGATKQEESWVKDGPTWRLETATALSGTPSNAGN